MAENNSQFAHDIARKLTNNTSARSKSPSRLSAVEHVNDSAGDSQARLAAAYRRQILYSRVLLALLYVVMRYFWTAVVAFY